MACRDCSRLSYELEFIPGRWEGELMQRHKSFGKSGWRHSSNPIRRRKRTANRGAGGMIEALEPLRLLAINATFFPATGVLSVTGDSVANSIEISRNAAGTILVNAGAVAVSGGTPTVANTTLVQV